MYKYICIKIYVKALRPVKKGENDFEVYIQPVQHHDVVCIGWLLFLHGYSEIAFWQRLLDKELQEKNYKKNMIGLRSKVPLDGINKTPFTPGELRNRPSKALNIEVHRDCYATIKNDIKEIFKKRVSKILQPQV